MNWRSSTPDPAAAGNLAGELSITPLAARVLLARGLSNPEECRTFLRPRLDSLHMPAMMPDMEPAARAIASAVKNAKKVLIYGDYDADGITGTVLLFDLLKMLGLQPDAYVPNRLSEGYGVSEKAAEVIAGTRPDLVITVDCGTRDTAAIKILRECGAEVVVIDHHEPGDSLPDAVVVNPKRSDSSYPFRDLAGVGVAFKVAWAAAEELSPTRRMSQEMREFLVNSLGLVCIGTVADVVPLVGENRVLTAYGLTALGAARSPGLRALMRASGLEKGPIEAHDVAFRIAPRLNAAGRLKDAMIAVKLLTTSSTEEAEEIAWTLDRLNTQRKDIQDRTVRQALMMAEEHGVPAALVLASPGWHLGVVGVAASKVVEQLLVPAVLLVIEGDTARGSARSVPGFNIMEALESCSDLLDRWGGHAMAAGMTLKSENLDALERRLSALAEESLGGARSEPVLEIDSPADLSELTMEAVKGLDRLAPFGMGNRKPVLSVEGVRIAGVPNYMGTDGKHLSFHVNRDAVTIRATWWNAADRMADLRKAETCSLVFTPRINTFNGVQSVELDVKDMKAG